MRLLDDLVSAAVLIFIVMPVVAVGVVVMILADKAKEVFR